MNILLLNPPFLRKYSRFSRSPAVTKSGTLYYPIWHAYAAGVLEKEGHDVKLVDAPADNLSREACFKIATDFQPQMVVVYTSTPSIYNDIEIAGSIKTLIPQSFVVLTGPHVSALPVESLKMDERIDAIARREYDCTLVDLSSALRTRESLSNVRGISFRRNGEILSTPDRELIEDLDSLPFVSAIYKKHLTIENYFYAHCRYPTVSIFTSRGCYARCNFCVYPEQMFGRKQRQRSPENIVAEFQYIEKEMPQVKEVLIDDDTFSFDQEHTKRFCELMIERQVKVPWTVECRANLNYETMVMMRKAGCRLIVIGFESADNAILKNIHKGITVERMRTFVADAKKAGILIHSCFMAGNQGETKETLMKSLRFAQEINADTFQFFPLMVYPGTEAYEWAKKNGYLLTEDYSKWLTKEGLHDCVVSTPELSAHELVSFCDYARTRYYLSPRYLLYKVLQMIRASQRNQKNAEISKNVLQIPVPEERMTK